MEAASHYANNYEAYAEEKSFFFFFNVKLIS